MKHFETEPTEQKVFWYVFVPGNGEPKEKHYSFQYAKAEAQRIARKTGKETFILQALKSYVVNDIEERNYMHEPKTFPLSIADFKKAKKELSKKKIKNKNADF
jgi:hypothetical protein